MVIVIVIVEVFFSVWWVQNVGAVPIPCDVTTGPASGLPSRTLACRT